MYGEKAGLKGYYDAVGNTENFPPAPNIVVEGGRIEFVRPSHDGTMSSRKNMISKSSQTFIEQPEKTDPDKVRFIYLSKSISFKYYIFLHFNVEFAIQIHQFERKKK